MPDPGDASGAGAAPALTLFLCGDVMTGRGVDQILAHPGAPGIQEPCVRDAREYVALAERTSGTIPRPVDAAYVWGEALAELERAAPDARIANLETSVTTSSTPWRDKQVHYRMHPANVGCLAAARLDVCALANNHVLDYGHPGLEETLASLAAAGVKTTGAGRDIAGAERPAIVAVAGGRRVVVHAAGTRSSGIPATWAATPTRPGVVLLADLSPATADALLERVSTAKRPGDVTVVSIHWGGNWGHDVPDSHVRFAHRLVEGGVDVVHGHSSHHPRPVDVHRGRLILYGCGDLIDDYEGIGGHEELRAELVLMYFATLDARTGALAALRMAPMRIRRMRLERASRAEAAWLAATLGAISAPHGSRIALAGDGALALERDAP